MTLPPYTLHAGLDEMLSPAALSRLEGRTVTTVRRAPFVASHGGVSGNQFLSVQTSGPVGGERSYIVKRASAAGDIIMRLSGDIGCREMLVWRHRLLDRLPPEAGHTILDAATDGTGWALLMRDITPQMHPCQRWPDPGWAPLTEPELDVALNGLAALHERFWEDPSLRDPALGLTEHHRLFSSFSPATVQREREAGRSHAILAILQTGWEVFEREAAPTLVRLVRALHADLDPFVNALARHPATLVHADPNTKNFGLDLSRDDGTTPKLLLLDWQLVTRAPPAVDLAYFLSLFSDMLPISFEAVIAQYRNQLAARLGSRFDEGWWRPQLDLGLLGQFLRVAGLLCWRMTHHPNPAVRDHYRQQLGWWTERVLAAERSL